MTPGSRFTRIVAILIVLVLALAAFANIVIMGSYEVLTLILLAVINGMLILTVLLITYMGFVVCRSSGGRDVGSRSLRMGLIVFSVLFPLIKSLGKMLGVQKDEIRRMFINLNNSYIYSQKYDFKGEEIMLLAPHCIQKSFCKLKVTYDVSNCKRCGKCSVDGFLKLREKYGVKVFIATGGTLARKIIVENKPRAIVAIACERDLTSGIQEVVKIPVLGVYNERPNGPCFNTSVNIENVENAIRFFMGEG